jgi:hypothetical protein
LTMRLAAMTSATALVAINASFRSCQLSGVSFQPKPNPGRFEILAASKS